MEYQGEVPTKPVNVSFKASIDLKITKKDILVLEKTVLFIVYRTNFLAEKWLAW